MSSTSSEFNASLIVQPVRKSLAVLLLGVVALVASLNLEHNRHIQQGLSGQVESVPGADISLLLHKDSLLQRVAAAAGTVGNTDSNDGKDKKSTSWLVLVDIYVTASSTIAKEFLTSNFSFYYASPRAQTYSPRAPPRI